MGQVYKKERKAVWLLTSCAQIVTKEDTSELFVSPDPEARVAMKQNQLMLRRTQSQPPVILITLTTSVCLAKVEQ